MITGFFTSVGTEAQRSTPREVTHVPPAWLLEPASDVLADLQAAGHVDGLQITLLGSGTPTVRHHR